MTPPTVATNIAYAPFKELPLITKARTMGVPAKSAPSRYQTIEVLPRRYNRTHTGTPNNSRYINDATTVTVHTNELPMLRRLTPIYAKMTHSHTTGKATSTLRTGDGTSRNTFRILTPRRKLIVFPPSVGYSSHLCSYIVIYVLVYV